MKTVVVRRLSWALLWFCSSVTITGYFLRHRLDASREHLREQRKLALISDQKPDASTLDNILDKQRVTTYRRNSNVLPPPTANKVRFARKALHYKQKKDVVAALMSPLVAYQDTTKAAPLSDDVPTCMLLKGAAIPMVLMMRVVSPPDGIVRAQVVTDVYDSVSLTHLIVPAGSRFIGHLDRKSSVYSGRLLIKFDQFVLPNGEILSGKDFYSADTDGSAGNSAIVDRHFWQNFAPQFVLAGLSTVSAVLTGRTVGSSESAPHINIHLHADDFPVSSTSGVLSNVSDLINEEGKIPATIRLDPGQRFIIINQKTVNFRCPFSL